MTQRPNRIALSGFPVDAGAGQRGACMGPAALRIAGLPEALRALGFDVVDHGDLPEPEPVDIAPAPEHGLRIHALPLLAAWTRAIATHVVATAREDTIPIFLGGDHSISMGTVHGRAQHAAALGRPLAVLWLDAHADFNTPASTPSGNVHGMSLAILAGEAGLDVVFGDQPRTTIPLNRMHIFGARSIDPIERRALHALGVDVADMRMIDEHGVPVLMRRVIEKVARSGAMLHVSFDVDVLDPGLAPGVGTTVPGGATFREAHLIMEMLHDSNLVTSLDLVELNPFLDVRGQSALLMAELTSSLFGRRIMER